MKLALCIAIALIAGALSLSSKSEAKQDMPEASKQTQSIVVAGGCFWCLEPLFEMVKGVTDVEVGYAGGYRQGVSYEQVCTGSTGHAESVKVTFDPKIVSADDLLRIFFTIHNPTTLNQQGPDEGTQYRSAIFYSTPEEKERAEKILAEIEKAKIWPHHLVTSIEPLKNYTRAEEYHQDYYKKFEKASDYDRMHMNAGYCTAIIEPKVLHFRERFKNLLKN